MPIIWPSDVSSQARTQVINNSEQQSLLWELSKNFRTRPKRRKIELKVAPNVSIIALQFFRNSVMKNRFANPLRSISNWFHKGIYRKTPLLHSISLTVDQLPSGVETRRTSGSSCLYKKSKYSKELLGCTLSVVSHKFWSVGKFIHVIKSYQYLQSSHSYLTDLCMSDFLPRIPRWPITW